MPPRIDEETKRLALATADSIGVEAAAAMYCIGSSTLSRWRAQSKSSPKAPTVQMSMEKYLAIKHLLKEDICVTVCLSSY